MPDPNTQQTSGNVDAGSTGQQTGLSQAQVAEIGAAVQSAVSQAMSQMQAQVDQLNQDLKKVSENTTSDVDSATVVRSSVDPGASQRRMEALAEMVVADTIEFRKAADSIIVRRLSQDADHHSALPPVAPRSASGPGTSAS